MLIVMQLTLTWVTTLDNPLQQDGELLASSVNKVVDPITGSINITGLYLIILSKTRALHISPCSQSSRD